MQAVNMEIVSLDAWEWVLVIKENLKDTWKIYLKDVWL